MTRCGCGERKDKMAVPQQSSASRRIQRGQMSVRDGVRWRRGGGKLCGLALLVSFGVFLVLRLGRMGRGWPVEPENWALAAVLLLASALMLIVATELILVAWRILRHKHPH